MNPQRIFAIMTRVILQFRHDHRTLGLMIVAPILIITILGYTLRQQENTNVQLALVNEDQPVAGSTTKLSDPIIEKLRQNTSLEVKDMTRSEATAAVKDQSEKVALIFPSTFSQDLATKRNATVQALVEGSNPSEAGTALATVAQSVMASAPVVLKELVPPQAAGLVPQSLPIQLATTRLYGTSDLKPLDYFAPMFIAYIGFFLIFLLTSVSFLRERTQGTMERISASPVTRLEMVLGYMLGFGFFSLIQAAVLVLFTVYALQIQYQGDLLSVFVVTLALVLGAVNLGILLSAFARNELQAIQFIPIVILPQIFLSGLLLPLVDMPGWLQAISRAMPLTYAIDALTSIMVRGEQLTSTWVDLTVLLGFAAGVAVLAALSVRREVA